MNTQTNIKFSIGDKVEHDDLGPGGVVKPPKAFQEYDDQYATVRFQNGMILRCRTKNLRLRNFLSKIADERGQIAIPISNDGKEQNAFEAWAIENKFSMDQHPLHWLFLDRETNGARRGWKAALEYVERVLAGALPDNCRDRLKFEGKSYPKSGCDVCENGGIAGCPYRDQVLHVPMSGLSLNEVLKQAGPAGFSEALFPHEQNKMIAINPKLLQGLGRKDEFTITLSAWNKEFADSLVEILANGIRHDMVDGDQEPEKAESHAPLRDRLAEIAGCFSAAEMEGWSEALQEGNLDRLRDIWNRRISYARDLAETATVEPPIEPMLSAPARVGATCFGVGVKWSTVIERAQREFQWQSENIPTQVPTETPSHVITDGGIDRLLSVSEGIVRGATEADKLNSLMDNHQNIEERIEQAFWHFDANKKGYSRQDGTKYSERDAFKWAVREMLGMPAALMAKYHEEVWKAAQDIDGGVDYDMAGLETAKAISRMYRSRRGSGQPPEEKESFQCRVLPWMMECFGPLIAGDKKERNHRFLEESLELVQACGCSADEAHKLVDYVYGRPAGEKRQEVGGVNVTLAALCLAHGIDMHDAAEVELERITQPDVVVKIREKQKKKPEMSPLPGVYPDRKNSDDDRGHYLHLDNTDNQICGDRAAGNSFANGTVKARQKGTRGVSGGGNT